MAKRPPRACYDLSKYLREALLCIETAKEQPIPTPLVKTMIAAMSVILTKIENVPDYNTVVQALTTIQNDLKKTITTVKTTAETVQTTAATVQRTATVSQQAILISQDTNAITREVAEAGKIAAAVNQETNNIAKAIQSAPSPKSSYALVLSSNLAPISRPITISTQIPSLTQAQREIIVKITNPSTIASL
jgi:hypothetical protein